MGDTVQAHKINKNSTNALSKKDHPLRFAADIKLYSTATTLSQCFIHFGGKIKIAR